MPTIDDTHPAQAEAIVDTVTFIICSSVGLAVDGASVLYVAARGETAPSKPSPSAQTIDELARRIESWLSGGDKRRGTGRAD